MQITCTQENFSRALSYLERVVGKQTTLPILGNFLLETEKGRLKISATNLEIGVVVSIGAKIEQEGRIAVPAKVLSHFINNLPSGDILELREDQQHLEVSSTAYQIRIKGVDGKDFPIIPRFQNEYTYQFPAQEIKKALSRLLFCVSVNEARLELTGVCLSLVDGNLKMAATDSFRLAEEKVSLRGAKEEDFQSLIIPQGVFQELLRVIHPESEVLKMTLEENQVFFDVDGVEITSRVINGKYPDYQQIIPKEYTIQISFERALLQRAVKIASGLSSYVGGEIALVLDGEKATCTVLSRSQEVGENKTLLPVEIARGTGTLTLFFNPRYLLEGINALESERILFSANSATTPVALQTLDTDQKADTNYLYIVMPIRK